MSFPPVRFHDILHTHACLRHLTQLFGHEIVAIFLGVIWGLGVGFAILAAGTFIGEVADY